MRVAEGGHNIDLEVIERRYYKGIVNLFDIYLPIVDGALLFDNSAGKHELMAHRTVDGTFICVDEERFANLKKCYHDHR